MSQKKFLNFTRDKILDLRLKERENFAMIKTPSKIFGLKIKHGLLF